MTGKSGGDYREGVGGCHDTDVEVEWGAGGTENAR